MTDSTEQRNWGERQSEPNENKSGAGVMETEGAEETDREVRAPVLDCCCAGRVATVPLSVILEAC